MRTGELVLIRTATHSCSRAYTRSSVHPPLIPCALAQVAVPPHASSSRADLGSVLGEVQLGESVKGRRGEGRQPDEMRLILFGEVPLQAVRSLDEPIVLPVEADQRNGQPSAHRRMDVLLGAEVPPLRMCPELLVGLPDRPPDLVGVRVAPVPTAGCR